MIITNLLEIINFFSVIIDKISCSMAQFPHGFILQLILKLG